MSSYKEALESFQQDRFGLFIHWGLYSLPARHEWLMSYEEIDPGSYRERYFPRFDPDLYNPEEWARYAAACGFRYVVLTVKHHEGFCLWDSDYSDYTAAKSPAGRDLLPEFLEAFRRQGIKVGFYYSLIDWSHPDFSVDPNHPLRNARDLEKKQADPRRYAEFLRHQVKELLTNYGKIDILWFDFSYPDEKDRNNFHLGKGREAWESETLYRMVRQLQPNILLNDRLDLDEAWAFKTPEQFMPRSWYTDSGQPVCWEACQTFSGSWGYYRDQEPWRSSRQILSTLIECVAKGGNFLLNTGPNARGRLDPRATERFDDIARWMELHSRSIYGCSAADPAFPAPENCMVSYHPQRRRLYIYLFNWPYKHLHLEGTAYRRQVVYAQLLNDGSEIPFYGLEPWQEHAALHAGFERESLLTLLLPLKAPDVEIPVIELFLG